MSYYRPGGIGTGSATNVPFQISQGGTGANTAAGARTNLGLGDIATQNKNAVNITGGSIAGITDLAIADGGTGASNAAQARTNLGLSDVASTGSYNDLTDKPSIPTSLNDLSDVSFPSAAAINVNDVLIYNGSGWIADTIVLTTAEITSAFGDTVLVSADIGVTIQAYDPNILVSGDIGVLVQAYDPDILVSGDIGVTIQPYDATILNASAIGSTVQAYDSNLTSFVGTFTLPTTDGTANQILKTDGAGNIGFASAAAAGVNSFNTRTGNITLTSGDVTTALGYTPLGSADIGVSVQGYDATLLNAADIGVTVQGYDATILNASAIGVTVQAYDATILNGSAIGSTVQAYDSNLTSFVGTFTLPTTDGTNAQVLTTNGAGVLTFASASTVGALNDLSDVTITSPSASQILRYDASATQWINVALPSYLPVTKYDTTTVQISVANGYVPVLNRAGGTVNISVV